MNNSSVGREATVEQVLIDLLKAPFEHPDILPTLLPIILGAVVIELYFGKHKNEELGWNTSVGNAVIWITTGVSLVMTESLTPGEKLATYSLIGLGLFVGYMNFFHKWSKKIAFFVSSAGIIYTLAYVLVVLVKTDLVVTDNMLKASLIFVIGMNIMFKIIQSFETPSRESYNPY